jgi:hypothetical protein
VFKKHQAGTVFLTGRDIDQPATGQFRYGVGVEHVNAWCRRHQPTAHWPTPGMMGDVGVNIFVALMGMASSKLYESQVYSLVEARNQAVEILRDL